MRILYDGQIYTHRISGGIRRYFANIIGRLPQDWTPILAIQPQKRHVAYPTHPQLKHLVYQPTLQLPEHLFYWLDKYYFKPWSRLAHPHLFHPTYYRLVNQQEIKNYRCPIVITVHDMIHEMFPEYFSDAEETIQRKRKAILAAQAIICVSENTKSDLLHQYTIPEEKITVIYEGSEIDIRQSYGTEEIPEVPYFLYVGSRAPYKNFSRVLTALKAIVSIRPDVRLCLVGPQLQPEEQKMIADMKLSDTCLDYGYVRDSHLAKLYRCSIALVYPSLYEGFGLPPLEAMSCGAAVIASQSSSIPEVVGEAGMLFDPQNTDELIDILFFLLDNPSARDRLIAKGFQRARQFRWEYTVNQTLEVYRSLTNSVGH